MSKNKDWVLYSATKKYPQDRMLCLIHSHFFKVGGSCEHCLSPLVKNSNDLNKPQATHLPLFPVENQKSKKKVSSSERPNARTGLSKRENEAYFLYQKGVSYKRISVKLKCSKSTAYEYVKKGISLYKANKGVIIPNDKPLPNARTYKGDIRLHNDSVSFLIKPIDLSMEKDCIKLKYDRYKIIKLDNKHIQVFSKKLVVRFLDDIWADNINDAKHQADDRIKRFWADFEFKGITLLNDKCEIVSRHYAIINTDLAKHFIKEKKRLIVLNPNDKGVRASIDFSHKTPEFEFENKDLNDKDVPIWRTLIKDSLENPIDTLSITKKKTDLLMQDFAESKQMLMAYTEQIKLHLEVMQDMKTTLKEIRDKLK